MDSTSEIDLEDLPLNDEFYETNALKTAIWQYLLDHCYGNMTDEFHIRLFVPNQEEFWRRVSARKYGKYKSKDIRLIYQKSEAKFKEYKARLHLYKKAQEKNRRLQLLRNEGGLSFIRWQIIIWLRRLSEYLAP